MLSGKTVILGVTGSIAAYKAAHIASLLKKQHADVHVIMTGNASKFITPLTFETLTGNKCLTDTFDRNFQFNVEHVELAKKADLVLIAPASANTVAKLAHGLADDMLTTTVLACTCPKLIAPAMNTRMFRNPVTGDNLKTLEKYGWQVIQPESGQLACSEVGEGRLPDEQVIVDHVLNAIASEKDMEGLNVLVTAGPTEEAIDPVRYITNHSSGKMGYAMAAACIRRGAEVTLVCGKTNLKAPSQCTVVPVISAEEMFRSVTGLSGRQDIIIMAAAVADYRPAVASENKIKKYDNDISLQLVRTKDILGYLGEHKKERQILCGFAMETENMAENAKEKLLRKNLDLIVANNLNTEGAGFGTDTNVVTLITEDSVKELELMSKEQAADKIADKIMEIRCGRERFTKRL